VSEIDRTSDSIRSQQREWPWLLLVLASQTPSTKTVVTAGAKGIGIVFTAFEDVPKWFAWVDHTWPSTIITPVVIAHAHYRGRFHSVAGV